MNDGRNGAVPAKRMPKKAVIREATPGEKRARKQKEAKIKAIAREFEAKKRALGLKAPVIRRGPAYYLVLIGILLVAGGAVYQACTGTDVSEKARTYQNGRAVKSLDAIAEALGRYKFHTGVYPSLADGGLEALADKDSHGHAGWVGPYLHRKFNRDRLPDDPWKHAYVYEPPAETNALPVVLSMGPDGVRGTADDVTPDPELFTKAFRDTTWTNDWVPFRLRGIIVVPKASAAAESDSSR